MIIVLREPDAFTEQKASRQSFPVEIRQGYELTTEKTLFVEPGTRIPFDLLAAGWHFLDRWDIAVPIWKYNALAADEGPAIERKATEAVAGDLRVMLYSYELLFVRNNATGQEFLNVWQTEMDGNENKRLAFLRALHITKPIACYLPISWLCDVMAASHQTLHRAPIPRRTDLVHVQIGPGQYVKCRKGDERLVLEKYGVTV
jgi:hypothetical protein